MLLLELHGRGNTFYDTEYKYLYHMTDGHGLSRTITDNALRPLRQNYISTTYDPTKDFVEGYSHYFYKFVLNGKALVREYGGFHYDHHRRVGDSGMESLNEKEIGIDTRSIEPFNRYMYGCALIKPLFNETMLRTLLATNSPTTRFLSNDIEKTQAPRTIQSLYTMIADWKKPLWIGSEMRKPNEQEWAFLKDVFAIYERGGNFKEGLAELSDKYPILDIWNKKLDSEIVHRRQLKPQIIAAFNKYYADRNWADVDVTVLRTILEKSIRLLGYGDNVRMMLMGNIAARGLLSPAVAPVDWGPLFSALFDGDIEEAVEALQWMQDKLSRQIEFFRKEPERFKYAVHHSTQF